jgi:hypothetical protein
MGMSRLLAAGFHQKVSYYALFSISTKTVKEGCQGSIEILPS